MDRVESKEEVVDQEPGNSESHSAINNCTEIQDIIISEIERIQATAQICSHYRNLRKIDMTLTEVCVKPKYKKWSRKEY